MVDMPVTARLGLKPAAATALHLTLHTPTADFIPAAFHGSTLVSWYNSCFMAQFSNKHDGLGHYIPLIFSAKRYGRIFESACRSFMRSRWNFMRYSIQSKGLSPLGNYAYT
ncbi:hypothetical protein Dda3937_04580 [Dickeya dadantii 3937]|uniref:Uncharacterized protein n=1 Tax=Dickeya dadantii (strain 3937) TaxID=198628 RepID=E0SBE9_DICD3|nr:hypothetical protein Dda3937_04580 [Dickeya dadantii 3937]